MANDDELLAFCHPAADILISIQGYMNTINFLMYFAAFGYLTSLLQKGMIMIYKDNVDVSAERLLLEAAIVYNSFMTIQFFLVKPKNNLISTQC
mmetsp:Transcript_626/g.719  ORF Transcript_626/g.719 Transcript_626/m.719 type:complete len:94 (+) Transcript_626:56-337(+)